MRTKKSKKKVPPLLWRLLKRYLANSSFHGIGYLVEDGRHWTERLFWLISCGLSWWGCGVLISGVLEEFENRRTAVTIQTNYLDWPSELPSLHLCAPGNPDAKTYIDNTWKDKRYFTKLSGDRYRGYDPKLPQPWGMEAFEELAKAVMLNCSDLFLWCEWNGKEIDCCEAFRPLSTPVGFCLSINSIYTTHSDNTKGHYEAQTFKLRRTGTDSLRVRFKDNEGLVKSGSSYTLYLLGNSELPSVSTGHDKKLENKWRTSEVVKIDVVQQPIYNEDGVRSVPVEKRNCRFIDENENLRIYRNYGFDACVAEAEIWRMYDICGCISHLLPRPDLIPVCNQTQLKCVYQSSQLIFNGESPGCVPDCEGTWYSFFQNYGSELGKIPHFDLNLLPGPTLRYVRYVVHSKLDVIVSVGSALGLFVGASILSLVEIPYWFIVRSIDDNN